MTRKTATFKVHSGVRIPIPDCPAQPRLRSKKDRRKWCGGKQGREHAWEDVSANDLYAVRRVRTPGQKEQHEESIERDGGFTKRNYQWRICTVCGKRIVVPLRAKERV